MSLTFLQQYHHRLGVDIRTVKSRKSHYFLRQVKQQKEKGSPEPQDETDLKPSKLRRSRTSACYCCNCFTHIFGISDPPLQRTNRRESLFSEPASGDSLAYSLRFDDMDDSDNEGLSRVSSPAHLSSRPHSVYNRLVKSTQPAHPGHSQDHGPFSNDTYLRRVEAEATAFEAMVPVAIWSSIRRQGQLLEEESRAQMSKAIFVIQRAIRRWTAGKWRRRLRQTDETVQQDLVEEIRRREVGDKLKRATSFPFHRHRSGKTDSHERRRLRRNSEKTTEHFVDESLIEHTADDDTASLEEGSLEDSEDVPEKGEEEEPSSEKKPHHHLASIAVVRKLVHDFITREKNQGSKKPQRTQNQGLRWHYRDRTASPSGSTGVDAPSSFASEQSKSSAQDGFSKHSLPIATGFTSKPSAFQLKMVSSFRAIDGVAHQDALSEYSNRQRLKKLSKRSMEKEAKEEEDRLRQQLMTSNPNVMTPEGRKQLELMRMKAKKTASLEDVQAVLSVAESHGLAEVTERKKFPDWIPSENHTLEKKWSQVVGTAAQQRKETPVLDMIEDNESDASSMFDAESVRSFRSDTIEEGRHIEWDSSQRGLSMLSVYKPHIFGETGKKGSMLHFLLQNDKSLVQPIETTDDAYSARPPAANSRAASPGRYSSLSLKEVPAAFEFPTYDRLPPLAVTARQKVQKRLNSGVIKSATMRRSELASPVRHRPPSGHTVLHSQSAAAVHLSPVLPRSSSRMMRTPTEDSGRRAGPVLRSQSRARLGTSDPQRPCSK